MANVTTSPLQPGNETDYNSSDQPDPTYVTSGLAMDKLNQKAFDNHIPSFVLIVLVVIVGIPGNLITVCVYLKKMRRTASRIFILALAFCDLINCVFTMPVEIFIIANFWTFDYPVVCSIGRTVTYVLNGTSALLLVGIAVDRFRKICRPLKPVFTPKQTRTICIVSCALGIAVYIPGFVLYGTFTEEIPIDANTIAIGKTCLIRDKFNGTKIRDYVLGFWFLLTVSVMVVLIIMYCAIGRAVYKRIKLEERRHNSVSNYTKSQRNRNKQQRSYVVDDNSETSCSFDDDLSSKTKKAANGNGNVLKSVSDPVRFAISQRLKKGFSVNGPTVYSVQREQVSQRIRAGRTTTMLFCVTIAYILSFIPFVSIVIIRSASPPHYYTELADVYKSVWDVALRSYVINCAVNPILYGFFNKDFRKRMFEFFSEYLCC